MGAALPQPVSVPRPGLSCVQVLVPGGSTNDFTAHLARFYQCPARLRCRHELTISQGWASAVCVAQRRLRDGELAVDKPVLVLCTEADTVLSAKGILLWSKLLSPLTAEPLDAPLLTKGLCQRVIGTQAWDPSEHDVLAAPSARRVAQALSLLLEWANVQGFAVPAR